MLLYILKSAICLAILLAFYKIFLERENMHSFKRFYLLVSLVTAFIIPFITFVEYVEIPAITQIIEPNISKGSVIYSGGQDQYPTDYLPAFLWSIYGIGIVIFGLKFVKNLHQIIRRIQKNPKYKINRITNVLLLDNIIPHTFFNYIFLNKHKFEAKEIPSEVLLHEETHAKQKHSLDVLFIEFLQVLLWFNPLMHLMKKTIKLNHEFLADREVLSKGIESSKYQNILLEFSSSSLQPQLANSINYSSIKKRFTVMKTKTSKKSIVLRSLLLLPMLALLLYGFSEKKFIEIQSTIETSIPSIEQHPIVENIEIRITNTGELLVEDDAIIAIENLKSFLLKYNTNLTKEQRSNRVRAIIRPDVEAPISLLGDVEAILINYGVAQVNIIGPEEYFDPNLDIIEQKGATKAQIDTYNTLAKKYDAQPVKSRVIPLKDLQRLETLYRSMSVEQKKEANPFPECPPQEGATLKQIKEYNAMALKYNRELSDAKNILIKKSHVERLEYLHGLMTHEQKENAEPFPDFPEPPAAPIVPNEPKKIKEPKAPKVNKGDKSEIPPPPSPPDQTEVAVAEKVIDEIIANQDPYDGNTVNLNSSSKKNSFPVRNVDKSAGYIKTENQIAPPPVPPTPISPLDHAIEMAKQGAIFYYGKKKITADEAIDLLKEDDDLSMDITKKNNNPPVVKIGRYLN